jgi:hypothetical protein
MWGKVWKPPCGWQRHVNVSLGIHYYFISFFSSPSSRPELSPTISIRLLPALWSTETIRIRAFCFLVHRANCHLTVSLESSGFKTCF